MTGFSRSASPIVAPPYTHHVSDVTAVEYPKDVARVVAGLGKLDVCVYCAGVGEFVDVETLGSDRRVFETNLIGAVATAQAVIPGMIELARGHFIGLSSQADRLIDPAAPSYAASKAGLSSYLEGLAGACRSRGVHDTNLRLGFVDTKMAKARVRPFMMPAAEAARRVRHCMRTRPVRDTYPKRMAMLLWLVRVGSNFSRWFR